LMRPSNVIALQFLQCLSLVTKVSIKKSSKCLIYLFIQLNQWDWPHFWAI
jgi:hypothetical protein